MVIFALTMFRIMFGDMFRRYVHMRKKMHVSLTVAIWAGEVLAVVSVHELLLHITIPTVVAIHESAVIIFAEE